MEALSQVCDPHLFDDVEMASNPTPGWKFSDILKKIKHDDFTLFCKFRGQLNSCEDLLEETVTDDGICKTFNMIEGLKTGGNFENTWSPEKGYVSEELDVYPHRAFRGAYIGLNILLSQNSLDLDFLCSGPLQGWKVKVHSPNEDPTMLTGFLRVPLRRETTFVVSPEVTSFSGSACHSTSTKKLKLFESYSQENCMAECLSSFVMSKCGCVKFSMANNDTNKICSQHNTKCASDAINEFLTSHRVKEDFPCDCKPSCKSIKYNTKVHQADFNFNKVFVAYQEDIEEEFPSSIMSRLVVYIDDDFYMDRDYRAGNALDSMINLISKIGGVLAFFLGASWISFIEIIYYLAARRN
jgi:acid-sensing ion channel, other